RSFEKELGREVIRPNMAGLMGAYGAALHGKSLGLAHSALMSADRLDSFTHSSKAVQCGLCNNHCNLTVNTFSGGKRCISGNRCERPTGAAQREELPNLFAYKLNRILELGKLHGSGKRGTIGIPLALSMYENLPFWHTFFTSLGFEVVLSDLSSTELYSKGRYTIPSDTVCYPAKLMHGHIENLLDKKVDAIFYPCLTYNFDEGKGDNHYNCPVVAYYSELMQANITRLSESKFLYPYWGLHRPVDFAAKSYEYLKSYYPDLHRSEVKKAADAAYAEYHHQHEELIAEGGRAIALARERGLQIVVLAGRPYHIDPEINHGIDKLIASFGIVILTEDAVADLVTPQKVNVLNQWTYHARLYNAAKYCTQNPDTELIQLVSFGCGIDAITTDEVRDIMESAGRLYTQLKIDEINNLGAVKIRIRSLLGAIEERRHTAQGVEA
ncbi:MAG: acyl-CoA dehydratase activase-related protein, partial [Angelakisella sp.]